VTDAARGVMCRELREYVFATMRLQMKEKKRLQSELSSPQVPHHLDWPFSTPSLPVRAKKTLY
jgi:hypothetical protein